MDKEIVNIDAGIPMPEPRATRVVYPYKEMEVGESFLVEPKGKETKNLLAVVCNRNNAMAKKLGRKFRAKTMEDGIRVWRVA